MPREEVDFKKLFLGTYSSIRFPSFADLLAASSILTTIMLFSSEERSLPGFTLPCSTFDRYCKLSVPAGSSTDFDYAAVNITGSLGALLDFPMSTKDICKKVFPEMTDKMISDVQTQFD